MTLPPIDDPAWVAQPSGLELWDVTVGTGKAVEPGATVTCHYTGWLTDGKVFDSSKTRGQTISFSLKQVIQGWQIGIPGMKPGGIRRLLVPSELGYGARGSPPKIPGGATLVFEVKLIAFN